MLPTLMVPVLGGWIADRMNYTTGVASILGMTFA